jgi:acyl-CoA synthetase
MNANDLAPLAAARAWGDETADYYAKGYWTGRTLASVIESNAAASPDGVAFITSTRRWTWSDYKQLTDELATALVAAGCRRYEHLALHLPEGPAMHIGLLAAEKAGLTAVGLPIHGGEAEIGALLKSSRAVAVLATETVHRVDTHSVFEQSRDVAPALHSYFRLAPQMTLDPAQSIFGAEPGSSSAAAPLGLRADEVFYLGATSGTTGLPKLVMMTQNRWFYFHQKATAAADLASSDVFLSLLPAASAFGLWSAHFTPAILAAPLATLDRFDAEAAIDMVVEADVSVLAGVTVQLIMMLNSPNVDRLRGSRLRAAFTGGESVPAHKAMEFEERTGAVVLQFYGSTETASISATTMDMAPAVRHATAGRPVPGTAVRLLDSAGQPVAAGERGRPAVRGPATSIGYFDDDAANERLFTPDGWLQTEDIAEFDVDGYLHIVGRASDFINRGGVKISPARIENELLQHRDVAMAAVVGVPDETYGERVWAYVVTVGGVDLSLADVEADIRSRGHAGSMIPEHLEIVAELPMASGGKVARDALRRAAIDSLGR